MVSFIANPDIALAREERQLALAKMLQGYTPPQNPYGYTTAGVFAPLAHALSARWKGQEASRLQAQQQEAQAKVLRGVYGAALPKSGPFYETVDTMSLGAFPGTREARTQIQRIADDGSVLPPEISAETARTAGIDPLTVKALIDDARMRGDVATQAEIEKELRAKLGEAGTALALNPDDENLYRLVQQIRMLLDPVAIAGELTESKREAFRYERGQAEILAAEDRRYRALLKTEERALDRALSKEERDALKWDFQQKYLRANRNEDTIAQEDRALKRLIEDRAYRTGLQLDAEDRAHLEWVAREEIKHGRTLSAEERAEAQTLAREHRALLATLEREKRAVATAIESEERRLGASLSAEERAATAYRVRAEFDDERTLIKEEARAKLQRIPVYSTEDGSKDSITQGMMDEDQKSKTPQYTYDAPEEPASLKKYEANLASLIAAGVDPELAQDIAYNRFEIITDAHNNRSIYNYRTEKLTSLEDLPRVAQEIVGDQATSEDIPKEDLTDEGYWAAEIPKYDPKRYQESSIFSRLERSIDPVTGLVPEASSWAESTLGQIPGLEGAFESSEVTQLRLGFDQIAMQIVKAFQQSPRYAEGERQQIRDEVKIVPSTWSSPKLLRDRLIQTARSLTRRLRREEEIAADRKQSKETRQDAHYIATVVRNALLDLGVPEYGGFGVLTISPGSATVEQLSDPNKVSSPDLLNELRLNRPREQGNR
tara:strand:- start:2799 stop:4952 length:2154 start_codon:yes stop_codon:yes gene_type:complete